MAGENIAALFSRIARYYDAMNSLFSLNRDRYWRRRAAEKTGLAAGDVALDVCCGTGLLTLELARLVGENGEITGIDFCPEMLAVAQRRVECSPFSVVVHLMAGDALTLPFPADLFPVVTCAFGLRNLPDYAGGLAELVRVATPGGRVVILELGKPRGQIWERLYDFYLGKLLPRLGNAQTDAASSYCWLPESLRRFPEREVLCRLMVTAGLKEVEYQPLTGGIAGIFTGVKK